MSRSYSDHLQGAQGLIQHTSSHRTHVHTPNVMLPHHHIDFYILTNFKITDFNKEHTSYLTTI